MNRNKETLIASGLTQILRTVCHVINPHDIMVKVQPEPDLIDVLLSPSNRVDRLVAPRQAADSLLPELQSLGVQINVDIPDGFEGMVKFQAHRGEKAEAFRFVAPWFVDLYVEKPLLDQKVQEILKCLNHASKLNGGHFIFRGEHSLFPSVSSTLSRRWSTNSSDALRAISDRDVSDCFPYLRSQPPNHFDTSEVTREIKLAIMASIQHMGGFANLVDFSTEIWVALFFACMSTSASDGKDGNFDNTGRIWKLDRSKTYEGLDIVELEALTDIKSNIRWSQQSGVVVMPSTGAIPISHLGEVVRIDVEYKRQLIDFLALIGITPQTMYSDIEGYIKFGQRGVTLEAICYMIVERLNSGDYSRAAVACNKLIAIGNNSSCTAGYYLRGLCHASSGRLRQAIEDLLKAERLYVNKVPDWWSLNVKHIQHAFEINGCRDLSQSDQDQLQMIRTRLSMELDGRMWASMIVVPGS